MIGMLCVGCGVHRRHWARTMASVQAYCSIVRDTVRRIGLFGDVSSIRNRYGRRPDLNLRTAPTSRACVALARNILKLAHIQSISLG
ncbi:MAG: hypothetical protein JWO42_1068 [Chloroflexi bacterium]|nr:hypothetical protein [Chloroflexota bacterium]